jgi:hypothetical protein
VFLKGILNDTNIYFKQTKFEMKKKIWVIKKMSFRRNNVCENRRPKKPKKAKKHRRLRTYRTSLVNIYPERRKIFSPC